MAEKANSHYSKAEIARIQRRTGLLVTGVAVGIFAHSGGEALADEFDRWWLKWIPLFAASIAVAWIAHTRWWEPQSPPDE